nr:MAG: hypothetical protein TU35_05660 [Thermoproteus sp. AZ2]
MDDKAEISKLAKDPRAVQALRELGGFLWFYTELYPYRTIYTLTICKNILCIYIAGEDMMDMKIPVDEYLLFEDDPVKLYHLKTSLEALYKIYSNRAGEPS